MDLPWICQSHVKLPRSTNKKHGHRKRHPCGVEAVSLAEKGATGIARGGGMLWDDPEGSNISLLHPEIPWLMKQKVEFINWFLFMIMFKRLNQLVSVHDHVESTVVSFLMKHGVRGKSLPF